MIKLNKIGGILSGLNVISTTTGYDGGIDEWTEANGLRKVKKIARHVLAHYTEYNTSIICPYCGADNNEQEDLGEESMEHVCDIIEGPRNFKCLECKKHFYVATELYPLYKVYDNEHNLIPYKKIK